MNVCAVCEQRPAVQLHHRKTRGRKGSDNPANLVPVCVECHDHIHAHPDESTKLGLLIPSWESEPVRHWSR